MTVTAPSGAAFLRSRARGHRACLGDAPQPGERRGPDDAVLLGLLIICAVLPYANTLLNGFVYDDITQVTNNPYIRSFQHLRAIFSTNVWSYVGRQGVTNYYRPLMTLGYLICYQLFGPVAYYFHLVNVALHAAVVCVLFCVTRRLCVDRSLAFVAAAAFALHPIHSESVAWIAAVTDLEVTLFYLLSFWFFLGLGMRSEGSQSGLPAGRREPRAPAAFRWRRGERSARERVRYILRVLGMVLSFTCALLSKEQALTLPLLAAVYEHTYREDRFRTGLARKLGRYGALWMLMAGYLGLRIHLLGAIAPAVHRAALTPGQVFLSAAALVSQYLWKLFWPAHLCAFYVFHAATTIIDPHVLAGVAAITGAAVLSVRLRGTVVESRARASASLVAAAGDLPWQRLEPAEGASLLGTPSAGRAAKRAGVDDSVRSPSQGHLPPRLLPAPIASFGLIWLFGTLAPVLNARWLPANVFAERYLYLPSVGFCWVLAWAWTALRDRRSLTGHNHHTAWRWALTAGLLAAGAASAARVVVRNLEWQNDIVLFTRTLTAQPDAYEIRTNLGTAYWAQGDVTDAEREWREALRLAPLSPIILNNLGLVCRQRKQYGQAVEFVRKSVQQKPDYTEAHLTLGITYEEMGLRRQAELEYGTALQLSPLNVCARNRLGRTYLGEGRLADAEREFAQSVKTEPNPSGFDGQGDVELASGRPDLAIRAFQAALKLNPIDSHAHFRLGDLEMAAGNKTAALGQYEAGLKTDPANSAARASISNLKAQTSNVESNRP